MYYLSECLVYGEKSDKMNIGLYIILLLFGNLTEKSGGGDISILCDNSYNDSVVPPSLEPKLSVLLQINGLQHLLTAVWYGLWLCGPCLITIIKTEYVTGFL